MQLMQKTADLKMWVLLQTIVVFSAFSPALVEGGEGKECYPTQDKNCFGPDYYLNWRGKKCEYGGRGGYGECWPWFTWYMEWLYLALVVTVGLAILGALVGLCCEGVMRGSDGATGGAVGCAVGFGITCPCCAIPLFLCMYFMKIRCELCGTKLKSHNCNGNEAVSHRQSCLEQNRSTYDNIPDSTIYKCKTCQTNLKLWPKELLYKSSCIKCEDDKPIVNNGSNLHVCFTCAATGRFTIHHLCDRHTGEGTITEVDWENIGILPDPRFPRTPPQSFNEENIGIPPDQRSPRGPPKSYIQGSESLPLVDGQRPGNASTPGQLLDNVLPPGWTLLTNPVTGAPYGLCDPSGEIKPLVDNRSSSMDRIPPPYEEAVAFSPSAPLASVNTCNEKFKMEPITQLNYKE